MQLVGFKEFTYFVTILFSIKLYNSIGNVMIFNKSLFLFHVHIHSTVFMENLLCPGPLVMLTSNPYPSLCRILNSYNYGLDGILISVHLLYHRYFYMLPFISDLN